MATESIQKNGPGILPTSRVPNGTGAGDAVGGGVEGLAETLLARHGSYGAGIIGGVILALDIKSEC